jgi:hypothetical protein
LEKIDVTPTTFTILHFVDMELSEISLNFSMKNIILSGGSNTMRHIINPSSLVLSSFIYITEFLPGQNLRESLQIGSTSLGRLSYKKIINNRLGLDFLENAHAQRMLIEYTDEIRLINYSEKGTRVTDPNKRIKKLTDYDIVLTKKITEQLKEQKKDPKEIHNYLERLKRDNLSQEYECGRTIIEHTNTKSDTNKKETIYTEKREKEVENNEENREKIKEDKNRLTKQKLSNQKRRYSTFTSQSNSNSLYGLKPKSSLILNNNQSSLVLKNERKIEKIIINIKKREYTTKSDSYIYNYLDKIEEVIAKNNNNLEQAQLEIEESWFRLFDER